MKPRSARAIEIFDNSAPGTELKLSLAPHIYIV